MSYKDIGQSYQGIQPAAAVVAETADIATEAAKHLDESRFVVSEENFKTPGMGDYYIGDVDDTYLKLIDEQVRNVSTGDAAKAAFYTETPPVTEPGYYPDKGVYFIKTSVKITEDDKDLGIVDGDTINIPLSSVEYGGDERVLDHFKQGMSASINSLYTINNSAADDEGTRAGDFSVRMLGLDAPEIPHWCKETRANISTLKTKKTSVGVAKSAGGYVVVNGKPRDDGDMADFIDLGDGKWREYEILTDHGNGVVDFKWLSKDDTKPGYYEQGMECAKTVIDLIERANGEVYVMADDVSLSRNSSTFPRRFGSDPYNSSLVNQLKQFADGVLDPNEFRSTGFNLFGQDLYRRFLGTVYVKIDGKWINLAKRLIAEYDKVIVNKNFRDMPVYNKHNSMSSNAFGLDTYDFKKSVWADAFFGVSSNSMFDDRKDIQKQLFNTNFENLNDWTVTIGDTTLFVPPTSVRCLTATTAERMPLIRAKGSMAKSAEKSERTLEMTLYFNDDRGINGYPYQTTLPNGESITYYINGLRALVSQFKFTPYLPITNNYINEVLNIEAVSLMGLQINTVPGFPKLIQASIVMQEFSYRVYMPEIPIQESDDNEYRNYFSSCINYKTMRYYYQRPILTGQELAAKGVAFNSKEYIQATLGNKTALQPMKFKSSNIKFYIANEEHLKKLLQTKIESLRKPDATIVLSATEKQAAADLAIIFKKASTMTNDSNVSSALMNLNSIGPLGSYMWQNEDTQTGTNGVSGIRLMQYTKGDNGAYSVANEREVNNKLNELLAAMKNHMNMVNVESGKRLIESISVCYREINESSDGGSTRKGKVAAGIIIKTSLEYLTTDDAFADMKRDASTYIKKSVDKFFVDRTLFIPFSLSLKEEMMNPVTSETQTGNWRIFVREGNENFKFDALSSDMMFLAYCNDLAGAKEDPNAANIKRKQAIDIEQLNSLTFDPYDVGSVRINNFSIGMSNVMSKIGLSDIDGYAPQYVGGQDAEINIEMITTSQKTAAMLNALPKLSSFYAREYRLVLPCWPLKLESELTAFMGINETLVDSVVVSTMDQTPGTYKIDMRLIAVDRTLRNREALARIEAQNAGYQGIAARTTASVKSYFKMQETLGKAEIYPDLELPTMEELTKKRFQFIRYKFQDDRVYPDPDFYFVYPHLLTSQIIRESIVNSLTGDSPDTGETDWEDKAGGTMKTTVAKDVGVKGSDYNDAAKKQQEAVKKAAHAKDKARADKVKENIKSKSDLLNVLNAADTHESWTACPDIRCIFLEHKYQLELESYKSFKVAQATRAAAASSTPAKTASGATTDATATVAKTTEAKAIEGEWVYNSMSKAMEAATLIQKYLETTDINESVPEKITRVDSGAWATTYDPQLDVKSTVGRYLKDDRIVEIMKLLNIENTSTFQEIVADIVYAAACATTGRKEYSGKKFDVSWYPDPAFVGVRFAGSQDKGGTDITNSVADAIENAVEFGPFRIKQYDKVEFTNITGEAVEDPRTGLDSGVNSTRYLVDPYYRYASLEDIAKYKKGCINNTKYATVAFFRIMLYWLKKLIDTNALPTISTDILRNAAKNELDTEEAQAKYVKEEYSQMYTHMNFFKKNSHSLDAGKYFAAAVLAMTSGDKKIRERIDKRDYKGLNGYLQGCAMPTNNVDPSDRASLCIRKMMLALVAIDRIKQASAIGIDQTMPATEVAQNLNEKKFIAAAEDPQQYMLHSFHDMTVHDCRGRMLRAFPTFYMMLVDEGREIGMWRLHDNFYNTSSIAEFQVVKSRKIAADTARIVMSNMYKTFTTEDEDSKQTYNSEFNDVWDSIFSLRAYAMKEEERRSKTPPVSRARIRPGARVHLRMGYGSNAANLPVIFNGSIAEVQVGDMVEIVAQGDGIEMMNPILENDEAHDVQYKHWGVFRGWLTNGATPMTILNALLTTSGGILNNLLKDTQFANILGRNPYGLYHFGDPDFKEIFKSGEPTQNIYEAMSRPVWGEEGSVTAQWSTDDVPNITFDIFGKSIWDIVHICKSVSPDFIAAIAPFGFRSTLFHGAPRYYYAYDYYKQNEALFEKRKPYQQFHIYNSFTDIIKNNMTTSGKDVKTCAVGLYQMSESGNFKSQHRCGPLWVDIEIYPEEQKTMFVDTQLLGKGIPIVGFVTNSLTNRLADWFGDDEGTITSHERIAWRMTASALKDSVKDMYQGEILLIGDPTVKPHDRMFINDSYENIIGQCLVKEVVHNFSVDNGFTTTVYPDCIAVVDDPHEMSIQTLGNKIFACSSIVNGGLVYVSTKAFGGPAATLSKATNAIANRGANALKSGASLVEKVGVNGALAKTQKGLSLLKNAMGVIGRVGTGTAVRSLAALGLGAVAAPAILANVAIIGTTILIGKYVTESIGRWAKNLQVLQIFPMKRHGLVMTAGINGNKGSVYGSPSYNDPGLIKGLYSKLTAASDNPVINFAQQWFFSEEMMNLGAKYKRDGGVIDDAGNPVSDEMQFNKTIRAVAGGQGEIQSSYKVSQLVPRAANSKPVEVKAAYEHFAILDTERLQTNPKLKYNRLISDDERLKPYIKEEFFMILHETPRQLGVGQQIQDMPLVINNSDCNVKAIIGKTKDGKPVYDLPLLNEEAMHVLYEIIRRAKNKMPSANASDKYQAYEETKGCFILLKSALRVGDTDSRSAAGFTFILQAFDKAIAPLAAAIKEFSEELAKEAEGNDLLAKELFDCKSLNGNEVVIVARMPSVI